MRQRWVERSNPDFQKKGCRLSTVVLTRGLWCVHDSCVPGAMIVNWSTDGSQDGPGPSGRSSSGKSSFLALPWSKGGAAKGSGGPVIRGRFHASLQSDTWFPVSEIRVSGTR